jgi:hypothetical protein
MYADETGNLDYNPGDKQGATPYFGFGTATFAGDHPDSLWGGQALRMGFELAGLRFPGGFHAKDDTWRTRLDVMKEVGRQRPRFDFTLLNKANAVERVKEKGGLYLYKLAWYLHFKEISGQVAARDDDLHVIVATFGTKKRAAQARAAIEDVCKQVDRRINLCVWDASTVWGLQLADYGLWAVQRHLARGDLPAYDTCIRPLVCSVFTPWGTVASAQS